MDLCQNSTHILYSYKNSIKAGTKQLTKQFYLNPRLWEVTWPSVNTRRENAFETKAQAED